MILGHCNRRSPYSKLKKLFPALSCSPEFRTEIDPSYAAQEAIGHDETEAELRSRTATGMQRLLSLSIDETCEPLGPVRR